ncbi:MAG: histidine kinase [Oscillospiraceae bacterium]|nr:histidine kinase [Oscillospiraceae bacterium]
MKAKSSLKYKLLALIVIVTVIPCVLIGIAAYTLTSSSLLESAISSTELMNTHKADTFDLFVEELEITLKDLTDSEATKAFLQLKDEPESDSYYLSVVRLGEKLDTLITQRGEAVSAVAFLWNDGSLPVVRSNGHPFSLLGDYRLYSPYKEMLQADAAVHWIVLQTRFADQSDLFLYKTIYDVLTEENLGLTLIRIDDSYIESILQTSNRTNDRTMLFTEAGELVFSVGRLDEGVLAADVIQEYATHGTRSHKIISGANGDFLMTRADSYEMGYKIINVTPLADIANTSNQVLYSIIISILIVLVIAIAMSLIFFRYLKTPIIGVHSAMANFRQGNLDERIEVNRTDELGQLGVGFNEMAEQINLLIVKNEQEQRKKQEISMRFLQAQISPHFLYNTLNSIKALSRMNRNAEACEMITSLISLLRLASGGSEEISLGQEIRYVESYVMLMCKRKDVKADLSIDLPDDLQFCKVLKFTLQPFVENSIIHGISDSVIKIHIRAVKESEEVLEIHISDNGTGFDTNILKVKKKTNDQKRFSRIGINNVTERIKLYYGDNFGIDIDSIVNQGTEITIRLPMEKMPEAKTGEL